MADPIIRAKTYKDRKNNIHMEVYGGLHYIRGNSAPYFSLTMATWRNGRENGGGAAHDEILKHYPELADLAAMHLSDIDGKPMHAVANGWYNLAGAMPDAFGDRYHRGNSDAHFADGYRKPTGDECLQFFADHCRISLTEAKAIRDQVLRVAMGARSDRLAIAKAKCSEILATMTPRWKKEAESCIAKHKLVVYGDRWAA